jgi:hypothetical protein
MLGSCSNNNVLQRYLFGRLAYRDEKRCNSTVNGHVSDMSHYLPIDIYMVTVFTPNPQCKKRVTLPRLKKFVGKL